MKKPSLTEDLSGVRVLIWQWGWLIFITALVSGGLAYVLSLRVQPIYQASTTILINQGSASQFIDYNAVLTSERMAQTYTQLLSTRSLIEEVCRRLDLMSLLDVLAKGLKVQLIKDTQLIEISLEDTDPARAVLILNTLVEAFIEKVQTIQAERFTNSKENLSRQLEEIEAHIQEVSQELQAQDNDAENLLQRAQLETTLAQYRQVYASLLSSYEQVRTAEAQSTAYIIQVDPPIIPQRPYRPRPWINAGLGVFLGTLIGVCIALVKNALDVRIGGVEDVSRHLGLPVLGLIPHDRGRSEPVTLAKPFSPTAEAYRWLSTNLHLSGASRSRQTILVTSPSPSDGKSTVLANLGIAFAQRGFEVAMLDFDLRYPGIHELLGISNQQGVSTLLMDPAMQVGEVMQKTQITNLSVISAGEIFPANLELSIARLVEVLEQAGKDVDVLLVDAPPVMLVIDTILLAPHVDGILLVVNPACTNATIAKHAVERLSLARSNILGVVLNGVNSRDPRYADHLGYTAMIKPKARI